MSAKDNSDGSDRRRFLITSAVVCVGVRYAGTLTACNSAPAIPPGPQNSALSVGDVAVGDRVVPSGADYVLARDAQGFYAYSNLCTHQGCALPAPTGGSSTCGCHGAVFDDQGNNLQPNRGASAPLPALAHYAVTFTGTGSTAGITVDTSMVLPDRTTRAVPPDAPATTPTTATDGGVTRLFRGASRLTRG